MTTDRERDRRRMMRRNRNARLEIEQLLTDEASYNENNKFGAVIDVDEGGIFTLALAWLDQQYRELEDDVFPLSSPPPRLAKFLEETT